MNSAQVGFFVYLIWNVDVTFGCIQSVKERYLSLSTGIMERRVTVLVCVCGEGGGGGEREGREVLESCIAL